MLVVVVIDYVFPGASPPVIVRLKRPRSTPCTYTHTHILLDGDHRKENVRNEKETNEKNYNARRD